MEIKDVEEMCAERSPGIRYRKGRELHGPVRSLVEQDVVTTASRRAYRPATMILTRLGVRWLLRKTSIGGSVQPRPGYMGRGVRISALIGAPDQQAIRLKQGTCRKATATVN